MSRLIALAALIVGCEPAPLLAIDGAMPTGPAALFDAGPLAEGVAVYADARAPLPDVSVHHSDATCPAGSAVGTICTPNDDPIPGAQVVAHTRDCAGAAIQVRASTDPTGYFRLDGLAPGPTTVDVSSGSFIGQFHVEVEADRAVTVAEQGSPKACLPTNAARLAVLTGDYDDIGAVISELGFEYDDFCGTYEAHLPARQLLHDQGRLFQYDVVFINCATGIDLRGESPEAVRIRSNLREFVARGGSIYVSDLAAGVIDSLWPGRITFDATGTLLQVDPCCTCVECADECLVDPPSPPSRRCPDPNALQGVCRDPGGLTGHGLVGEMEAQLVSPILREAVGEDALMITFELNNWMQIADVAPGVEVLVSAQGRPLMVRFRPSTNAGQVAYTSFHNHAQATLPMLAILRSLVFSL